VPIIRFNEDYGTQLDKNRSRRTSSSTGNWRLNKPYIYNILVSGILLRLSSALSSRSVRMVWFPMMDVVQRVKEWYIAIENGMRKCYSATVAPLVAMSSVISSRHCRAASR
jgi:hypothetical protein